MTTGAGTTTETITVTTPFPAGVTAQAVLNSLHDHETYIKTTCPGFATQKHLFGSAVLGQPCGYEITAKRGNPNNPSTMMTTTFKMTLTNVVEGVDAVVESDTPLGEMVVRSRWRVSSVGGPGGSLEEVVDIEGSNKVTKQLVKTNVEKSHSEYHNAFIAEASRG
ncbi:hypothetical protein F4777DRAFT_584744 [Nemania sp. FL0916]|nr:hypothetical protein F4777DRAFT_584744 [Nemania sp. FL0916]